MFDKNKIYGHTEEDLAKSFGRCLIDDYSLTKVEPDEILTRDEIRRMFPEQFIYLTDVKFDDSGMRDEVHLVSGRVLYYQCNCYQACELYMVRGKRDDEFVFMNIGGGQHWSYGYNKGQGIF